MIIAEPVQNAGGALVPPEGYWAGPARARRPLRHRARGRRGDHRLRALRRVLRLRPLRPGAGPDHAAPRASPRPTRRWAPCSSPTGSPSRSTKTAGCCCTASPSPATRWRRRSRCATSRSSSARACWRTSASTRATCATGSRSSASACRSSATCAAPATSGRSSSCATPSCSRFSAEERERLLRGFLTGRLLEEGLIARPDDRGDAVLHLAPPLICGRRELDEMVAKTEAVLTDASERFFVAS